jgi:uncharacterized protein (DUF433 family)
VDPAVLRAIVEAGEEATPRPWHRNRRFLEWFDPAAKTWRTVCNVHRWARQGGGVDDNLTYAHMALNHGADLARALLAAQEREGRLREALCWIYNRAEDWDIRDRVRRLIEPVDFRPEPGICRDEHTCGGEWRIEGTRLTTSAVYSFWAQGGLAAVREAYPRPDLTDEQLDAAARHEYRLRRALAGEG